LIVAALMLDWRLFFVLHFFSLLSSVQALGPVAGGSYGDPVVNIDFGTVDNPKRPITTYKDTSGTCPNDGYYTLASGTYGCFGNTWHTVTHDHTGNPGGLMMVVNAANDAGEFFKQKTEVGALCENTTYEFSAYIMNLIVPTGGASVIKPNITFIVETTAGVQIGVPYNTGDINETQGPDGWQQFRTIFKTPPGVTEVVIKMINNAPGGIGNDLLLDDITFRAYGPTVQAGISGNVLFTEDNICQGNEQSYQFETTPGSGYAHPRYQWQQNLNGTGWTDMAGAINLTFDRKFPANAPLGRYEYRIGIAEGENISSLNCRVYSNPVTINITSYPAPLPLSPASVCQGEPLTLTASGGATYKWTLPDGSTSTQNPLYIPKATATNAGPYQVEVTSAAGCTILQKLNVTVLQRPVAKVTDTALVVCRGKTAMVTATGGVKYSWSPILGLSDPNIENPVINTDVSTLYTVTVTGSNDCSDSTQVMINVVDSPVADAGADKRIFEGQSVKLNGSATGDIATYSWSPADYLDNPHSPTPIASPPNDTHYLLTVASANNCGSSVDDVFVRVFRKIFIPSSFTPNGDGTNDTWNIVDLDTYPDCLVSIYNRNGQAVFQSKGYGKPWDGKLNGNTLPGGTYYYVIDLKTGKPNLSGWVLLLR
jgi:gliding motility-associated-like protein